jgi:hypothetical protein
MTDIDVADQGCSTRGGGDTQLYCNTYVDISTSFDLADASAWTCQPAQPAGSDCVLDTWCSTGPCDPDTGLCTESLGFFPPQLCGRFVKK